MKGAITVTKGIPYDLHGNAFYGDMAAWLRATAPDNKDDIQRLKRNLRMARREELTPRQRQMLKMRFDQKMSVTDIARELGVNKSTVSRTIRRAKTRLYRCLRYTL